ncbi:nucleotide exchange factor GrpE [Solwaraspora sp. WMMD791]|uniref:nucleotide exchange factor GrpE n=1 Tax=Solwaraspora sp. WMMD791 TaxID=3016086 RepID=UPI00249C8BA6|nr:nucleotide exchange factor GrpE [Solwaraspora sp. WMMD791]WFE29282.1 nucleotide exchange factor GrpE [Solwaraspora sp. WMMD791]
MSDRNGISRQVFALLTGAVAGWAIGRFGSRPTAGYERAPWPRTDVDEDAAPDGTDQVEPDAGPTSPGGAGEPAGGADTDRTELVRICIDLADRLRDQEPALWQRLTDRLSDAGVQTVLADGERFDPQVHEAVGQVPTDDPAAHLLVASTEFAGYRDGGAWLRRPEVVVYRTAQ